MINLKNLSQMFKSFGHTDENIEKLIGDLNEFRAFNDFMIEKYQLNDDKDVENMVNEYLNSKDFEIQEKIMSVFNSMDEKELNELNDDDIEKIGLDQISKYTGEVLSEFAKNENYDNLDKLQESIDAYVETLLIKVYNEK
jgi:chaperonin cofactor prefoldin